eukprot:m.158839 g.158839  ORF g.158839 m.158839 type:complete len:317 (-) comp31110_c0_seq3:156-1106(-)
MSGINLTRTSLSAFHRVCGTRGRILGQRRLLRSPNVNTNVTPTKYACVRWIQSSARSNNAFSEEEEAAKALTLEKLRTNAHYEKYKEKLEAANLAKRIEIVEDIPDAIDELQQKMKKVAKTAKEKASKSPTGKLMAEENSEIQSLDKIVRLDLMEKLDVDAITVVWKAYHDEKESICAVVPVDNYTILRKRALSNPNFIFPLPREQGFEFFYGQWRGHQFAFTSMLEYKTHEDNARPFLLLNHYVELAETKDVVLMSGELDENMSPFDAQLLANQIQLFYLGTDDAFALVETFNKKGDDFNYQDVIDRIDTLGFTK